MRLLVVGPLHLVSEGGPFAGAFAKLEVRGFKLRWKSRGEGDPERARKAASKTKYACPECGRNVWA